MKSKKLTALCLAGSLIFGSAVSYAQTETATVIVNGETLVTDVAPIITEGRTLVPLRAICEALGCDVYWNEADSSITIFDGTQLYMMWLEKNVAFATTPLLNSSVVMDVPPSTINDRTLIPLRALSELLPRAQIDWNGETSTVTVTAPLPEMAPVAGEAEQYAFYTDIYSSSYDVYSRLSTGEAQIINADITLADGGVISLELYPEIAPESVINFMQLAQSDCFDNKIFHRVIKDFMIQGGAIDTDGIQYETPEINGEFLQNNVINLLSHKRGVISMARTNEPNSASNQFFITHADSQFLDGMYAAFGKVISGMEYVDQIAAVQTNEYDQPVENIVIADVTIKNAELYSDILSTPITPVPMGSVTAEPVAETLQSLAAKLGMTYPEFIIACGIDPNLLTKESTTDDLEKVITLGAYIDVFYGGDYTAFMQASGLPADKISRDTILSDAIKILEEQYGN